MKKSAKKINWIWIALGILVIVATAIIIINVLSSQDTSIHTSLDDIELPSSDREQPKHVKVDEEFELKVNEEVILSDLDNATLKLVSIKDERCKSEGGVVCFWEGQIVYVFNYEGNIVNLCSVLQDDRERPLDDNFSLSFISGDEKAGIFTLRKIEE